MRKHGFLLKIMGVFRSYLLLILIAVLMISQLIFTSSIFQIDVISNSVSSLLVNATANPFDFAIFILVSLLVCCSIWYGYGPLTLSYLFLKNRINKNASKTGESNDQHYWIARLASKISRKLNIAVPKIVVDKTRDINAKVFPGFIHPSLIVLSQGLLDKLTPDEIETVIAHELAHVAMQDTYSMSVTDILLLLTVWMPVYFCHLIIDYVFLFKWRNKNIGFIFSVFTVLLCYGFLPLFVLNTINRRYELRADKIAIQSTNLQSFLSALNTVHESQQSISNPLEWCLTALPKTLQVFVLRTFLSHPSIPARIQALL